MTSQKPYGLYDLHAATLAEQNRRRWIRRLTFTAILCFAFSVGIGFGRWSMTGREEPTEVIQPEPFRAGLTQMQVNDSVLRVRLDSLQTEVNMLWTAVEELEATTLSDHARAVDYVDAMEAERVTE